ncbi:hypothetical protein GGH91_001256 [Coemansia sp. RSA 2671]|nr:hypothetical protein LPJ60_000909 [Coemansia sp. RSA 2675]KAJ2348659.1 hypothetical protein GGH91_001256 [Coemansia sp. RSA 2671]
MASRLLALLSRAGPLPTPRVPTLVACARATASHQRRSLRLSASRRSTVGDWDHIEPLASACEKYAGWLESEEHDSGIAPESGSAALNGGDMDTREQAEAILINALWKNPPSTPGVLLERIAEGRAIASSSYMKAVIESMLVSNGESLDTLTEIAFKPHLLNEEVCTRLMLAIHQSSTLEIDQRIDSRVLVHLFNVSRARGWNVDPTTLEHVAMYLARNSLIGITKAIRHVGHWSRIRAVNEGEDESIAFNNAFSDLDTFETSLATIWQQARVVLSPQYMRTLEHHLQDDSLDTIMDIARLLDDKQYKPNPDFGTSVLRALCARERRLDAEWLFERSQSKAAWKDLGVECLLMMSLYYRIRDPSTAEAIFDRFRDEWRRHWDTISSTMVMPDEASLRAEYWRQSHEENAEPRHTIHAATLYKQRGRAAGPFYRRALELVRTRRIDEAMRLLDDSRHKEFVAIISPQLSALVSTMLTHGFVDQAYAIHIEFQRSVNKDSEKAVIASDILLGSSTHTFALTYLVRELSKLDDWDRIWCAIGDHSDSRRVYPHIDFARELLDRALTTGNAYHAVKCARLVQYIGIRDKRTVLSTPENWIELTLAGALKLGAHPDSSQQHPFVDVVGALLFTDVSVSDQVYSAWNAAVVGQALAMLSCSFDVDPTELHLGIYHTINQHNLTRLPPMCAVLQEAAVEVLDTIPESLKSIPSISDDVSCGWAGYLSSGNVDSNGLKAASAEKGVDLSSNSAFWECTVRAFACPTETLETDKAVRYLLLALKLAFLGKAKVSPIAINTANAMLRANECPVVSIYTGDLERQQLASQQAKMPKQALHASAVTTRLKTNPIMIQLSKEPPLGGDKLATNSPTPVKATTSLDDKLRWYNHCRQSCTIPTLAPLAFLVRELMSKGKRQIWEHIVNKDMPLYVAVLGSLGPYGELLQRQYAMKVWSDVIYQYARLQKLEEAVEYHRRIVDAGSYPRPAANAEMLAVLVSSDSAPVPALPSAVNGHLKKVFGMRPAFPPSGESPADQFLAATQDAHRAKLVAKVGLGMLYTMLHRKMWPTVYFYTVLLRALGKAGQINTLRQVFEVVMPEMLRALPLRCRTRPNLISLPDIWTVAISEAVKGGHHELAKLWFTEYRMSAMPLFREEGSSYSRIVCQDLPSYVRLLRLSPPYYVVPQIGRRGHEPGVPASTWYDLEQVEMQLEMDRLRALDKLPLPYYEAAKMLNIYTNVPEHNDMCAAEGLAAEILALNADVRIPVRSRPNGSLDLAYCWKNMVSGYIYLLRQQLLVPSVDDVAVAKTKERLAHWFKMWNMVAGQCKIISGDSRFSTAMLTPEQVDFVRASIGKGRGN